MRTPGMPLAQISTLKPFGTLSLSTGISATGVSVILPAWGASLDSFILSPLPWCQAGGAAALSAGAGAALSAGGFADLSSALGCASTENGSNSAQRSAARQAVD